MNTTGDASATPHGASLRMVPLPPFHVSESVSGAGAPDTFCGVTATMATHAPVTATPAKVHRIAKLRAFFTLVRFPCFPTAKR